jgi:uncharacterized protein (TIGR03905 family)
MDFIYVTKGTCSRLIDGKIEDGKLQAVSFIGGCRGNLQAVARLATGRPCKDVVALLQGIECRNGTSCPDQLAMALRQHCLAIAS